MASPNRYFMPLLLAAMVHGQEPSVAFNGPRSLAATLRTIQSATGTPINYEEPAYENPADLVRTDQKSYPGLRPMLVARMAPQSIQLSLPGLSPTSDAMPFVEAVLAAYHKAGLPGAYKVGRKANGIDVFPSRLLGRSGAMKDVSPVMGREIQFPYGEQTAAESLQTIVDSAAKASGHRIKLLSGLSLNNMGQVDPTIHMASSGRSAAEELFNLTAKAGIKNISYQLLFDPNDQSYYLSMYSASTNSPR